METFSNIVSAVDSFVWGPVMLVLLVGTGIFLTVRIGFATWRNLPYALHSVFSKDARGTHRGTGDISPFAALMTALAATIGTGNIVGVATALVSGGPGALVWMEISAIFGLTSKFSECMLAIKYRTTNDAGEMLGGPMTTMKRGLKNKTFGAVLAMLFAIFAVIASFGIGNMTQSNAISTALQSTLGINPYLTGAVIVVIAAIVLLGGIQSIAKVTSTLVPIMGCAYAIFAILALIANASEIPHALAVIFEGAFHPQSIAGGVAGYTVLMAIRFGVARGVFSNEAGLGSAPIAHAAAVTDSPVKQGFWGAFEVFFDTLVICTLTSLVIVSSGLYNNGMQGADLTIAAFGKAIGPLGTFGVTLATVLFAISTILGWSYYGEKSIEYLFKGKSYTEKLTKGYRAIFVLLAFVGAVSSLTLVWSIADTLNGLMAIPNLIGLLGLNGVIIRLVREFFKEKH